MKELNDTKATGDSLNCTLLGRALFGNCRAVFIKDTIAYSCHGNSLLIFNIKNPSNPILLGYYDTGNDAWGVFIVDSYAYVADGYAGLRIINVSDPSNPVETGFYDTGDYARGVFVMDLYAYVADDAGVRIINVSDPSNPVETGFYYTGGASDVFVVDSFAYVAAGGAGLRIINISDPAAPVETGFYDTGGFACGVFVIDSYAYVADGDAGVRIIKYPMGGSGIADNKLHQNVSVNNYNIKYNTTTIDMYFGLKARGELILNIYDKMGRQLNTLNNSIVESGYTKISINKSNYPAGEYFIKGKMGNTEINTKIMIIK